MSPEIKLTSRLGEYKSMKILKFMGLLLLTLAMLGVVIAFEISELPVGSSVAGIVLGFSLPALLSSLQDIFDTTDWKYRKEN